MKEIEGFVQKLSERKSTDRVFNPYEDPKLARNLLLYLQAIKAEYFNKVLLVGEAPGYKGCRITGIPFTCGDLIKNKGHKLFREINNQLYLKEIDKENTANITWKFLKYKRKLPLFWNSFPFHPHHAGKPFTNRAPNALEIEEGKTYLEMLIEIFSPDKVAAIGRKGETVLNKIVTDRQVKYIRHPSYGGKQEFLEGMRSFYR